MFRLTIEYFRNGVIKSPSKLVKSRPERKPPKPHKTSSKSASALLRSLCKLSNTRADMLNIMNN